MDFWKRHCRTLAYLVHHCVLASDNCCFSFWGFGRPLLKQLFIAKMYGASEDLSEHGWQRQGYVKDPNALAPWELAKTFQDAIPMGYAKTFPHAPCVDADKVHRESPPSFLSPVVNGLEISPLLLLSKWAKPCFLIQLYILTLPLCSLYAITLP